MQTDREKFKPMSKYAQSPKPKTPLPQKNIIKIKQKHRLRAPKSAGRNFEIDYIRNTCIFHKQAKKGNIFDSMRKKD